MDLQFHLRRIFELRESFIHGHFFPEFSFNEFHGSATMVSYPYISLFSIVLLSFLIKSPITLIYVFFMFNTFLTFIISFYSCRNYIKSNSTSYIFSIIYSLSNVFLAYNFVSMDLGIVFSFVALPLSIFGFANLIKGKNSWLELSLGMCLIFFGHLLNVIIVAGILMIWLLFNVKLIDKVLISKIMKSVTMFLMVTGVIWSPLLNFYIHNFRNIVPPPSFQLTRTHIIDFLKGIYGGVNFQNIGFFALIAIFISILFYNKFNFIVKQMYWLSLLIVLITLFFPWEITSYGLFKLLNQIQFTFRFLFISQMFLSFIFSLIITKYLKFKYSWIRNLVYFSIIFIAIILQLTGQKHFINKNMTNLSLNQYLKISPSNKESYNSSYLPNYKITKSNQFQKMINTYHTSIKYNYNTSVNDYIPKSALSLSYYVNNNYGYYNQNKLIKINRVGYNTFNFNGIVTNDIKLPIYIYNNEDLKVYLNNQPINYYASNDGLLTINIDNKETRKDNKLYIEHKMDKGRVIGLISTIIGIIFLLIILIKRFF